jgi:cell division protein YceG involved in septum cleavage
MGIFILALFLGILFFFKLQPVHTNSCTVVKVPAGSSVCEGGTPLEGSLAKKDRRVVALA